MREHSAPSQELVRNTPVVLTMFNRPEQTSRVLGAIRSAQPRILFLISDAGRTPEEEQQCQETRDVIERDIDWQCDVRKNYAPTNMGPKQRLSSGIAWVFSQVDRAIILEHDCLPHPDFFPFCADLLERYKDDERVMHVSGDNFQANNPDFDCSDSYYFSLVPHVWGFATWARSWKHYDVDLSLWPQAVREGWLANVLTDAPVRDQWEFRFDRYHRGLAQSWDGQWVFACFINNGLCINPKTNLVSNIGFGPGAFSTTDAESQFASLPTYPLPLPLTHPTAIVANRAADAYTFEHNFGQSTSFSYRGRSFFKNRFPKSYRALKKFLKKDHS